MGVTTVPDRATKSLLTLDSRRATVVSVDTNDRALLISPFLKKKMEGKKTDRDRVNALYRFAEDSLVISAPAN